MIDPSGKLLTGKAATKRQTEMGFARSEESPKSQSNESISESSSGTSFSWEAPPDLMEEVVQQVRQEMKNTEVEPTIGPTKPQPPRQSVIQEWTEEQLLSILLELSVDSPEARELLREVKDRVDEYFDLERFRKI